MVGLIITLAITLAITLPISILWAIGIDNMNGDHPDYDGKDFLDFD